VTSRSTLIASNRRTRTPTIDAVSMMSDETRRGEHSPCEQSQGAMLEGWLCALGDRDDVEVERIVRQSRVERIESAPSSWLGSVLGPDAAPAPGVGAVSTGSATGSRSG
jgi:hypothetical protein